MLPTRPTTEVRAKIVVFYKKASYCYAAPLGLLLLGFIAFIFATLALLLLLPLSIAGLFFTKRGLALAVKSGDQEKMDVGHANLTLGIILAVLGLLSLGFCYVVTS